MNSNNLNPNPNLVRPVSAGGNRKLSWLLLFASLVVVLLLALNPALSAFAAPGDLDPTFSSDGKVTTDFGRIEEARAVAIQSNGKIVAAGNSEVSGGIDDFALSRYNADGSLDLNFDVDGKVTTDFFASTDRANAVAIQSDGKIVAAGYATDTIHDFALARYNPNGSLDSTFSEDGKVTTSFFGYGDVAYAVAIQSDGKIVAAGVAADPSSSRNYFALARYTSDGNLDYTFNGDGTVTTDFRVSAYGYTMAIQSDGKIVVAGLVSAAGTTNQDFALARYNPNGSLDTSFGGGTGLVTTDFFGQNDGAYALAIQSDGKIVAAGDADHGANSYDFALARYLSDGSLDTTFSGNGKVFTDLGGNDYAYGVAIQSNGKIVAGGSTLTGTGDFALARFTSNGGLDLTFGSGGKVTTDFSGSADFAYAVAIQGDDKIVAAGSSGNDFALARYDSDTLATPTPTSTILPTTPTRTTTRTNTALPTNTPLPTHTPLPTRTPITCPFQFTDVLPNSTFYVYIQCLVCRGIVSGYPDGTFRPGNNITRGQLSKIVSNAAGFNDPQTTQIFEDIPIGSAFFDYIGRLASRGYIGGFVCGGPAEPCVAPDNLPYFRPNANASRGQISKIVSNAAGFVEPAGAQMFEDVAPGSTFYDFIERLTSRGIIGGYVCGGPGEPCGGGNLPYFRPSNNSTRGQTSKIVSNTFFPGCQTH